MINKLKSFIKKEGLLKVSADMGYKSVNSITRWIKANKIPLKAQINVKSYLKSKEK